ncbi:cerebellar degeneration-related protein 2-like [Culicoides brevitarsis]|uniref:cerebellar degeneration-related protein 2-like n=1 Tax=Culicoides brevitarsis TaxID=469753 RepID=UPI00307C889F
MASNTELQLDWLILCKNKENWDNTDLQLAAELGKTLLERNKELEQVLKHHQNVIDDQAQEIEYLRKQNAALREVNDSRLRIYEQLEVSIQDLERDKHRLAVEYANDKKKFKSASQNIECLETKCDELSRQINELQTMLDMERKKNKRLQEERNATQQSPTTTQKISPNKFETAMSLNLDRHEDDHDEASIATPTNNEDINAIFIAKSNQKTELKTTTNGDANFDTSTEEAAQLKEYEEIRANYMAMCDKITELEEQLRHLQEENQNLQLKIATVNETEEMRSVQDELAILEEVRQGQMCTRCLRNTDARFVPEEDISFIGTDDGDDESLIDLIRNSEPGTPMVYRSTLNIKDNFCNISSNPYQELVDKYEALLEVQRRKEPNYTHEPGMSLHEELAASMNESSKTGARPKDQRKTPTNMSETETLSSGFSEDTCHKTTQTECLINAAADLFEERADLLDCRFQNKLEYKELFKEIFTTLKNATDPKNIETDENPFIEVASNNRYEELSECTEDAQSIISSVMSDQSLAMSECITKTERRRIKKQQKTTEKEKTGEENRPPVVCGVAANGRLVTPYNRDPLLDAINISGKKRARRSKNKKDKYAKPLASNTSENAQLQSTMLSWNAEMAEFYSRMDSPTPSLVGRYKQEGTSEVEFKPSSASKELHKLKKLDLSYAEVLKSTPKYKTRNYRKK